ncbi:hypothetical protein LZ30DRAFT_689247 [Colletotrichum cereale]|nr:hypothetical protein LZ30DRAFT_689247 [Colletotrichum cereale]
MRGSVSALILFTVASVALGAVVAVAVFNGKYVEPHAASSPAATTAITEIGDTPATTSAVFEMDPLWTINTVKPETIAINIRPDRSTATAAVDDSLTIECERQRHQNSIPMCTYRPGFAGRDPVKVTISSDPITLLGKSNAPIIVGDHEGFNTLDKKQFVASVPMAAPAPTSIDCKYKYCDDHTQYCMYWAGVTGWNPSLGPVPGMTRTGLGVCQVPATDFTTYREVPTTTVPTKRRVCSTKTTSS